MEVKVYATLRDVVGAKSVHLDGVSEITVEQMLQTLFDRYPTLQSQLLNSNGDMHSAFHILINGRDARYMAGLETKVTPADEIRLFPPVGGGRS